MRSGSATRGAEPRPCDWRTIFTGFALPAPGGGATIKPQQKQNGPRPNPRARPESEAAGMQAKVYLTRAITPERSWSLYNKLGGQLPGKVAVKVHSG